MSTYNTVIFDLDGTLTDPREGIVNSIQYALEKYGKKETDPDNLLYFIGPPLIDSFMKHLTVDETTARKLVKWYREYFVPKGMFENELYAGMKELLEDLKNAGKTLFVATSKPQVYAKKILDHFSISNYFSRIVGSNLDGSKIEKDHLLEEVLQECSDNHNEIVMVGDRKFDILGAKHHGIKSIGVLFGYGKNEELKKAQADYIVSTVEELRNLLIL